jgi:Ca2+-dependent lipid-binding protein
MNLEGSLKVEMMTQLPEGKTVGTGSLTSVVVKIFEARNLRAEDFGGKSDPYAEVGIKGQAPAYRTAVVPENLNPTWNQECVFSALAHSDVIRVDFWDKDFVSRDPLGYVEVPLSQVASVAAPTWLPLNEGDGGKVMLSIVIVA